MMRQGHEPHLRGYHNEKMFVPIKPAHELIDFCWRLSSLLCNIMFGSGMNRMNLVVKPLLIALRVPVFGPISQFMKSRIFN